MTSARTILVATDLSAPARHAVERAFRLAGSTGSDLSVLHVMELDTLDVLREMLGNDLQAVKAALNSDARTRLDQLAGDSVIHRGVSARTCVAEGNPLATIAAQADAQDAQLVILGARGESVLRHVLMGSTAMRLLRKTVGRPVLVVKQAPRDEYRRVLVTVDFSPVSIQAIRLAKHWAPNAELVLLHTYELPYGGKLTFAGVDEQVIRHYVIHEGEVLRRRVHDLAAAAGLAAADYLARVAHGDPTREILAIEEEMNSDLIVVGKHGSHIAEELLLGSVTKHVLSESQSDVLVICDRREAPDQSP